MHNNIENIQQYIAEERQRLINHPLYQNISCIEDLKRFTEGHVYAVWDFMSLLKFLQIKLTCTTLPWVPSDNPDTRYLINEIVLAEESDVSEGGKRLSHYELYLEAMKDLGADYSQIENFISRIKSGKTISDCIAGMNIDDRIKEFLRFTFDCIDSGKAHIVVSAFTFGREDLIPDMFTSILKRLKIQFPDTGLDGLIYYFQRHIDLDGDEHGPLAMRMIQEIAGNDENKWLEMQEVAKDSLIKRIALWDAIYEGLK
ncbi:DUF3050 domain-containing protein [Sphingobacterium sp. JB170]|uniref:DUF3050 domain-containing protein n=1 Tax=Sphingobacterium sp. JB170 TaxID=1434842 RepID=UPI00097EDFAA|nr:DUF3050 domain-containing protein [Sphingobacterium sp. JB170]SJN46274.1 PROBABLE REMNANT OF A TRANSPOSASE GENE PROTEIN [Sphingobacterium sp. JB170]